MKNSSRVTPSLIMCAVLLLGACGDGDTASAEESSAGSSSRSSPSVSESVAVSTPVDGIWRLEQTRADVVRHLKQYGFSKLTDRFLRAEGVTPEDNWEWEFQDGRFTARWLQPDGVWKVADYGTFEVQDDQLALTFPELQTTTTFTWSVEGDELALGWAGVDRDPRHKGLPDEAYWRAYLSKPLMRVD